MDNSETRAQLDTKHRTKKNKATKQNQPTQKVKNMSDADLTQWIAQLHNYYSHMISFITTGLKLLNQI